MKTYDIGIGWASSIDKKFVYQLKAAIRKRRRTYREISYRNLSRTLEDILRGRLNFKTFVDLSSFEHPGYMLMAGELRVRDCRIINDPYATVRAASKASLHELFDSNDLPVRKTFILAANKKLERRKLRAVVRSLGLPFVLTPAVGGGYDDVQLNATTVDDILKFIELNSTEDCLAQEYIVPTVLRGRVAWFRPIFACGKIIPHWWDPQNHFYQRFGGTKEERGVRHVLEKYMNKIARLTGLDLFSTEMAMTTRGIYVIIDYANHPIDLNSQEIERDALPPETLYDVAGAITNQLLSKSK